MLLLPKLEVDVNQESEVSLASDLAVKFGLAAVVVHPSLAGWADMCRKTRRGQYKIIVPVDHPRGDNLGTTKFRGMPVSATKSDGFEIMLTAGRSKGELTDEAAYLTELVRNNFEPRAEVRFVVHAFSQSADTLLDMCAALASVRTPALVRIDQHTKTQISKANPTAFKELSGKIRQVLSAPLKLSGNFTTIKAITECSWAQRIAVSLPQLDAITKESMKLPDGLREMLT